MTGGWRLPVVERAEVPSASVVICSRNRAELLRDAVASVLASQPAPAELVVVDQSDAPDSHLQQLTRSANCEIRYLWKRAGGASRARNEGAGAARHEIIAFLDDDVLVERDWFGTLSQTLCRF